MGHSPRWMDTCCMFFCCQCNSLKIMYNLNTIVILNAKYAAILSAGNWLYSLCLSCICTTSIIICCIEARMPLYILCFPHAAHILSGHRSYAWFRVPPVYWCGCRADTSLPVWKTSYFACSFSACTRLWSMF